MEGIEGGVLAGEHGRGGGALAGLEEELFLGAIGEGCGEFAGRGEAGAAVSGEGGVGGREGKGTEDCGIDLHLQRLWMVD